MSREALRLAFVAALQHLPPRQRAVLILCEVLRWKAAEVAELLDTSVASVNSALQRARATLESSNVNLADTSASLDAADAELLARYVKAFEQYDMEALTSLIQEDATQSMPPYERWLEGRDDIFRWWFGPGAGCLTFAGPWNGTYWLTDFPSCGKTSATGSGPSCMKSRRFRIMSIARMKIRG